MGSKAHPPFFCGGEYIGMNTSCTLEKPWLFRVLQEMNNYPVVWGLFHKPYKDRPVSAIESKAIVFFVAQMIDRLEKPFRKKENRLNVVWFHWDQWIEGC